METVTVGIVGAGFSAQFHVQALRRVVGVNVVVIGVVSGTRDRGVEFATRFGIPRVFDHYEDLLADRGIDVVCICAPGAMHAEIAIAAAAAGKHIICEKPLTIAGDPLVPAAGVDRALQELDRARASAAAIASGVTEAGVVFAYAENWIYAPTMTKTRRLLEVSGGAVLDIRAEQSHSGSHAAVARRRSTAGGGALMTLGAHPIAAAIHLKRFEGELTGHPNRVTSVTAEVARLHESDAVARAGSVDWIVSDVDDIETWASVILGFSDGTKAVVVASFAMLGGVRNSFEVYTTNAAIRSTISPNTGLTAFSPEADSFGQEALHEKTETRAGWNSVDTDGDWDRGYPQEMQDFIESIVEGRAPLSGLELASDVIEVIYSSYVSAEEGRRREITIGTEHHR